jgi:outer membrane receptor protein involved in Fe transport
MARGVACRNGARLALVCAAASLLGAPAAQAAPVHRFEVPAEPLNQALLDLAVQANVSIAVGDVEHCARMSQPVRGAYTLAQALDQMLDGGGCGYQMVDASAVRVFRLRPAPRRSAAESPRPPAPPQPRPPAPVKSAVGEVVVTATRRTALAARIPDAIGVLSGERLEMARDAGLSDLSGRVAGLIVTNLGPGSDKVIMRGLSDGGLTGHAQSTVGIYLDDTRLTYNAPDPDLRLTDIDQIETLQGPQGAIYGAGSIGGVVHVVTRPPDLRRFGGVVSVEGAGTVGGGPSGVVEGVLNAPIIPGRLGLRVAAYDEHDGGYVDDVVLHKQGTNSTDRVGGRLALRFDVTPDWSVDLGFVGQHLHSSDSQYATQHLGGYRRPVRLTEPHGNDFNELHLTLQGQTGLGQFKNTLSFVDHSGTTRYDASVSLPLLADLPIAPTAYDEADRIQTVIDEATLASVGASPVQWLVGAFVSVGRQGVDTRIATLPAGAPGVPVYSEHRTDSIQEYALYGEASYDLTPQLTLSAGARLGVIDIAAHSRVADPANGGQSFFLGHRSDLEIAPKISLSYRIDDSLLAYVLVSEGQRAGGFNTGAPVGTMFSAHAGDAEPLRRFEGDKLWNVEAGVKVRALSDRLSVRAFAFYAAWRNIQSDQLLPSGLVYTANIGDGRNIGIEADVGYKLGDFDFHLTSLLDEPELTHRMGPFPALLHSGLPGVPRGSVGAQIHYEQRDGGPVRPFFDASVNYVGQSRLDFAPLLSRRMGNYTLSRLTGGVDIRPWRLSAFIDNPLGVRGDTFSFGNPFSLRHSRQVTPLPPPTGGIQITRSF